MGWTYQHRDTGTKVVDFLKSQFNSEKHEIIAGSVVHYRTAYLACKDKITGAVFALVCLLDYKRNDYYNFGYKDMSEDEGPYYFECPRKIIELLTTAPITETARIWRQRCLGGQEFYN